MSVAPLTVLPPVPAGDADSLMGRQITDQWERVKAGVREQIVLGAMMLKVRDRVDSARGANSATRGPTTKGTGLKAWMETHAPTVSEGSAYRLMEIAEGIRENFALKRIDLEMLLTAQLAGMDAVLAKKRGQIEEVIAGKSQRQLLLQFGGGTAKERGGARTKTVTDEVPLTPAEAEAKFLQSCRDDFTTHAMGIDTLALNGRWKAPNITDGERDDAAAVLEKLAKEMKAFNKLPQKLRSSPSPTDAEPEEGNEAGDE